MRRVGVSVSVVCRHGKRICVVFQCQGGWSSLGPLMGHEVVGQE